MVLPTPLHLQMVRPSHGSDEKVEMVVPTIQSTLALRAPRYYGHPANTDRCKIPG